MDTITPEVNQPKQGSKAPFVIVGLIVLGLIGWGIYSAVNFVNQVNTYEKQELAWRGDATNFINALVQFDQNLTATATSTKK